MGPPNQSLPPPNAKDNPPHHPPPAAALRRRNNAPLDEFSPLRTSTPAPDIILHNHARITLDDKPSYESFLGPDREHNQNQNHQLSEDQQFNLLRDSLVFNHERIIQGQGHQTPEQEAYMLRDSSVTRLAPSTPPNNHHHHPSLHTMNRNGSNNFLENDPYLTPPVETDLQNSQGLPNLYSTLPARGQRQNMRNDVMDREQFPGWMGSKDMPYIKTPQGEGKALSGAAASLHLPSRQPTAPTAQGGADASTWNDDSGTIVTTAYSYKCDRTTGKQEQIQTVVSTGLGQGGAEVKDCDHGGDEMTPIQERTPEEDEEQNPLLMKDSNKMLESTQTDTDLVRMSSPVGAYATDEDLDDGMTSPDRQLPPFFPNPDDLKWPELSYLRTTLPKKYQPFLAISCKKDCRTWLYKNGIGKRARQLLAESSSRHALSSSGQDQAQVPRRELQCFDNPPDGTMTTEDSNMRKSFADNDDPQMLPDNDSNNSLSRFSSMRDNHPNGADNGGGGGAAPDYISNPGNPFNYN